MKSAYFHEDDYCQIEILPLSAWEYCANEMEAIDTFSEAHKTDSGWTDMYIRKEHPVPLSSLGLTLASLKDLLSDKLLPYDEVFTGYSSYRERYPNCVAWGGDDAITILADHDAEGIIRHIWLSFDLLTNTGLPGSVTAVQSLSQTAELMMADWQWGQLYKLTEKEELTAYFQAHV